MTETLERPDVDVHDLAALDFEISCDMDDCEQAADWWHVCLACGAHSPICEPHRREQVLWAESAGVSMLVACPECGRAVPAGAWRRQFSFIPIGRS